MYSDIFDNPLILTTILSFMDIEDCSKVFHISPLKSLIHDCIVKKKETKQNTFYLEIRCLTEQFIDSKSKQSIPVQKKLLDGLFEHHVANKWFVEAPLYKKYALAIKHQLIFLVEQGAYDQEALYYLDILYRYRYFNSITNRYYT
jgi:hypothetical protein